MIEIKQSPRYHCTACDCITSGIIAPEGPKNRRQCLCQKPLLHCEHCLKRTSGTRDGNRITCDECEQSVTEKSLNIFYVKKFTPTFVGVLLYLIPIARNQ